MISLIKTSLRLMLRNRGVWFFLLATPILSAFVLNLRLDQANYGAYAGVQTVTELESCSEKAVYNGDMSAFTVKVYDAAKTELSEYVLQQLAENSMFSICRADARALSGDEIAAQVENDAYNDRAGVLLYLKSGFDQAAADGDWQQGLAVYEVSEDARTELFARSLDLQLGRMDQIRRQSRADAEGILAQLEQIQSVVPQQRLVQMAGTDASELDQRQINQKSKIGYAYAILTLGFLFCGVFVAHLVIEEQNNQVFTRILLTKTGSIQYFAAKFAVSLVLSLVLDGVLGVCMLLMPNMDVGIGIAGFLLMNGALGLIFGMISLLLGVLLGDVMSSNYAAFAIWSISALIAGLYFPLEHTTTFLKVISYLTPQKWFMDAAEMLIMGDSRGYSMVLCVTAAYLIIILSVGSVGIKIKSRE